MCTAVHAILSILSSFALIFFRYLVLRITSFLKEAITVNRKRKKRSENETEFVKSAAIRLAPAVRGILYSYLDPVLLLDLVNLLLVYVDLLPQRAHLTSMQALSL